MINYGDALAGSTLVCLVQFWTTIALAWALFKIRSLVLRIDRMAQLREHPEYFECKSFWRVLREVL